MSKMKHFEIATNMFDDSKIKYLRKLPDGNSVVLMWVMLLALAGKCNSHGAIFLSDKMPYTQKALAEELGFEENVVCLALEAFIKLGMIEIKDGIILIQYWHKYKCF